MLVVLDHLFILESIMETLDTVVNTVITLKLLWTVKHTQYSKKIILVQHITNPKGKTIPKSAQFSGISLALIV